MLLAKRQGEEDYDGTFTFIGGKMEITDQSIVAGLQREKDEEIGTDCKISLLYTYSHNVLYRKKSGDSMILPHYLAYHESGAIKLSEEYSEYQWVPISILQTFEPKVANIYEIVTYLQRLSVIAAPEDFVVI